MRLMDIWMLGLPAAMVQARQRKKKLAEPVEVQVPMRAFPPVLNMADQERVQHAVYRLDAIERHIAQTPHVITERRMAEFNGEALQHLGALLSCGQIDQAEADEHLKRFRKF